MGMFVAVRKRTLNVADARLELVAVRRRLAELAGARVEIDRAEASLRAIEARIVDALRHSPDGLVVGS